MCPGGPADGRLVPGDQLVKINDIAVDDLTPEQAAEIIRSVHANTKHWVGYLNSAAFSNMELLLKCFTLTNSVFAVSGSVKTH